MPTARRAARDPARPPRRLDAAAVRRMADARGVVTADVGAYVADDGRRRTRRFRWALRGPHARDAGEVAGELNGYRSAWASWSTLYRDLNLAARLAGRSPDGDWSRPVWFGPGTDEWPRPEQPPLPVGGIDPYAPGAADARIDRAVADYPARHAAGIADVCRRWLASTARWASIQSDHLALDVRTRGNAAAVERFAADLDEHVAGLLETADLVAAGRAALGMTGEELVGRMVAAGDDREPVDVESAVDRHNLATGRVAPSARRVRGHATVGEMVARRIEAVRERAAGGRGKGAADLAESVARLLAAFGYRRGTDPRSPTPADERPEVADLRRLGLDLAADLDRLRDAAVVESAARYWSSDSPALLDLIAERPGGANSRKNKLDALFGFFLWLRDKSGAGYAVPIDLDDYRMRRVDRVPPAYDAGRMRATFDLAGPGVWRPRLMLMLNCAFGPVDLEHLDNANVAADDAGDPAIFRQSRPRIAHKSACPTLHTLWPETSAALDLARNRDRSPASPLFVTQHGTRPKHSTLSDDWRDRRARSGDRGATYELKELRAVAASAVESVAGHEAARLMLSRPLPKVDRPYLRRAFTTRLSPAIAAWGDRLRGDGVL